MQKGVLYFYYSNYENYHCMWSTFQYLLWKQKKNLMMFTIEYVLYIFISASWGETKNHKVTLLKSYESKVSWVWIFLIFGHMTGRNIIYVLENNNILFSYHSKDESTWKQCWQTDYCACLVYTGLSDGCREKILQLYTISHNVI